jgi:hypothetical protein
MSNEVLDDDLDYSTDEDEGSDIRSLRRAANSSKKLKAELMELKRELAFARAGIPMSDPRMKYFVKGYEGEMEADAIREAAIQAGFIGAPQGEQQQAADPAVFHAQERVIAASAGAVAEDVTEAAALARMEVAMAEGGLEAMLEVARQYGLPTSIDS